MKQEEAVKVTDGSKIMVVLKDAREHGLYQLAESEAKAMNDEMEKLVAKALEVRQNNNQWMEAYKAQKTVAEEVLAGTIKKMDADVSRIARSYAAQFGRSIAATHNSVLAQTMEAYKQDSEAGDTGLVRLSTAAEYIERGVGHTDPPTAEPNEPKFLSQVRAVLSSIMQGHLAVLHENERIGQVKFSEKRVASFEAFGIAIEDMRKLGDELDIDTRELPFTWTLDLDWVLPPPDKKATMKCMFGCGCRVFNDMLSEHCPGYDVSTCKKDVGIVPEDYESEGTTMGAVSPIICELSGQEIDTEAEEVYPAAGLDAHTGLPYRNARYHNVDASCNRRPLYHGLLQFLHSSTEHAGDHGVAGAAEASELLRKLDPHWNDLWVKDKSECAQSSGNVAPSVAFCAYVLLHAAVDIYWLQKYVIGGRDLIPNRLDTPASMIVRACEAYENRPALVSGQGAINDRCRELFADCPAAPPAQVDP